MIGCLLPKQMRYQAAPLPEPRKALGLAGIQRKRERAFAATGGGTRQEQAMGLPE
jgi:hypothetical protein